MYNTNANYTKYNSVNQILSMLVQYHLDVLGEKIVGYYVYGSLIWGGFDEEISDLDMLCVLKSEVTQEEIEQLRGMHESIIKVYPIWKDRIEVQYHSSEALWNFREKVSNMGNISPGEPIHIITAGKEWLSNWYFVLTYGVTLYGEPPQKYIPPITKEEFLQCVIDYAREWKEHIANTRGSRPYQSYAILTMCRALYTKKFGEQVSKIDAADWAKHFLPEYKALIENALIWRKDTKQDIIHEETYPQVKSFVLDINKRFFC